MFTRYIYLNVNHWKSPNKYINWMIYFHRDIVEPDRYINKIQNFECWPTIKY